LAIWPNDDKLLREEQLLDKRVKELENLRGPRG
jgi:hypothetical protein